MNKPFNDYVITIGNGLLNSLKSILVFIGAIFSSLLGVILSIILSLFFLALIVTLGPIWFFMRLF